jgi:predicted esterase
MLSRDSADKILSIPGLRSAGAHLTRATGIVVAIHGRGADASSILGLVEVLAQPDIAFIAPQSTQRAWYPQSFIAPIEANEPWLSQSLAQVGQVLDQLEEAGAPADKTGLVGFSQGACLALETAIRRPRPYGALLAFSGGYIGPMGPQRLPQGSLDGTNAFLGCSDVDPHIPVKRVRETTALLEAMGAKVTERIYPGFGHAINDDEVAHARRLLVALAAP